MGDVQRGALVEARGDDVVPEDDLEHDQERRGHLKRKDKEHPHEHGDVHAGEQGQESGRHGRDRSRRADERVLRP